jgi:hypothetical protein
VWVLPQLRLAHRSQEVKRTILVEIVLKVEVSWLLSLLLTLPWLLHGAHHLLLRELLRLHGVETEAVLLLWLTGLATSAAETWLVVSKALSKLVLLLHVELGLRSTLIEAVVAKLLLLLWVHSLTHTLIFEPSLDLV